MLDMTVLLENPSCVQPKPDRGILLFNFLHNMSGRVETKELIKHEDLRPVSITDWLDSGELKQTQSFTQFIMNISCVKIKLNILLFQWLLKRKLCRSAEVPINYQVAVPQERADGCLYMRSKSLICNIKENL